MRKNTNEQIFEMNAVVQRIKGLKKTKTAELHGKKSVLGEEELAVLMEALDSCYNGVVSRLKEAVPNLRRGSGSGAKRADCPQPPRKLPQLYLLGQGSSICAAERSR